MRAWVIAVDRTGSVADRVPVALFPGHGRVPQPSGRPGPVAAARLDVHRCRPGVVRAPVRHGPMPAGPECPGTRGRPTNLLERWLREREVSGDGRRRPGRGLWHGPGLGVPGRVGFATVAFDFSPPPIAAVRRRFPDSPVDYRVADLLDPPPAWAGAFDLVVESLTVQSLPRQLRRAAIARVRSWSPLAGRCWSSPPSRARATTRPTALGHSPGPRSSRSPPTVLEWLRLEDFRDPDAHRWRAELRRTEPSRGEAQAAARQRRPLRDAQADDRAAEARS
jgi:hypothetical protein